MISVSSHSTAQCAFVFLALSLACPLVAAPNLIENGDFEADAVGEFPAGWADFPTPISPPSAAVHVAGAAGTSGCLRIRDVADGKTSGLAVEFPAQDRIAVEFYVAFPAGAGRVFNFWTREPGGDDASQINLAIQGGALQQFNGKRMRWEPVTTKITASEDANSDGDLDDPQDTLVWHRLRVVADRHTEAVDIWLGRPGEMTLPEAPTATVRGYRTDLPFGSINLAYGRLTKGRFFYVDEITVEGGDSIPPTHEIPEPPPIKRLEIWEGEEPPVAEQAPYLDYVTFSRVHRAIPGEYQFLHGPAIVDFKGTLFTSWANSLVNENSDSETLRGRRSRDGGRTWMDAEFIAPGFEGAERHSHGVFLELNGKLWAFCSRFGKDTGEACNFPGLTMEAFVFDERTGEWEARGKVAEDCWPMTEPQRMADGSWIIPGLDRHFRAAVAISHSDELTQWDTVKIPLGPGKHCSETTAWVTDDGIIAIMRNESPHDPAFRCAAISRSTDNGRTWTVAEESNFPMLSAKAAAGVLSTGQRYIVSNSGLKTGARWPLTIAVGRPGAKALCRMWRIRDGRTVQPLLQGSAKDVGWQYPYAYENDGKLYVIYSVGKEDCELAIIPLESLRVE